MNLNNQNLTEFRDQQIASINSTFETTFTQYGYTLHNVTPTVLYYKEPQGRQIGFSYEQRGSQPGFEGAGFLPHNGAGHGDSFTSIFDYLADTCSVDLSAYSFNNPNRLSFYTPLTLSEVLLDWYKPVISQPDFSKKLCEWLLEGEPEDEAETFFPQQLGYLYRLSRIADGFHDVVGSKLEAKTLGSKLFNTPERDLNVDNYPEVSAFLVYDKTETNMTMISYDGTHLTRTPGTNLLDFLNAHATGQRNT